MSPNASHTSQPLSETSSQQPGIAWTALFVVAGLGAVLSGTLARIGIAETESSARTHAERAVGAGAALDGMAERVGRFSAMADALYAARSEEPLSARTAEARGVLRELDRAAAEIDDEAARRKIARLRTDFDDLVDEVGHRSRFEADFRQISAEISRRSSFFNGKIGELTVEIRSEIGAGRLGEAMAIMETQNRLEALEQRLTDLLFASLPNALQPENLFDLNTRARIFGDLAQQMDVTLRELPVSAASVQREAAARRLIDLGTGAANLFDAHHRLLDRRTATDLSRRRLQETAKETEALVHGKATDLWRSAREDRAPDYPRQLAFPFGAGAIAAVSVLATTLFRRRPQTPPPPTSTETAGQPAEDADELRVLLVEDEPLTRTVTKGLLERRGAVVTAAESGGDAVAAIGAKTFDIVLLDLHLPDIDGNEVVRRVRALSDPAKARIPIVALTASIVPADAKAAKKAGVDAVLAKPMRWNELEPELLRLVSDRMTRRQPSLPLEAKPAPTSPEVAACSDLQIDQMREMLPDARVDQLLKSAMASLADLQAALEAAWEAGDTPRIEGIAHRIAGLSGVYGCLGLRAAAQGLELAMESGASGAKERFAAVKREMSPALGYIASRLGPRPPSGDGG